MTISNAVFEDHKELNVYYKQYLTNKGNPGEQQKWLNQFVWELARHSVGEEIVVYPAFERYLPGHGKAYAEKDREDHQKVKILLAKLQDKIAGEESTDLLFAELIIELNTHIDDEENNQYPELEKVIGGDTSNSLEKSFLRTKHFVPTRSHPAAPNTAPFETVAGFLAAPIDKLTDLLRSFPSQEEIDSANVVKISF